MVAVGENQQRRRGVRSTTLEANHTAQNEARIQEQIGGELRKYGKGETNEKDRGQKKAEELQLARCEIDKGRRCRKTLGEQVTTQKLKP